METTFKEIGLSITVTTVTTMVAFLLGSLSTIPGVRWLCWYAFVAMGIVFFYQVRCIVVIIDQEEPSGSLIIPCTCSRLRIL